MFSVGGVLILVLLSIFATWQLKNLSTRYSIEQFFPADHPLLKQERWIKNVFELQQVPSLILVVERKQGTWLEKTEFDRLKKATEVLRGLSSVRSVVGLTTVEGAFPQKKALIVGSPFDQTPIAKWPETVRSNPLLTPQLISKNFKSTLIVVEPAVSSPDQIRRVADLSKMVLKKNIPEARVSVGGVPALQTRFAEIIRGELTRSLGLVVLAFCLVFFAIFSHWTAVLLALFALGINNLVVLGGLSFFGVPIDVLLTTLPILVSICVMSLLIHTLHLWADRRSGHNFPGQQMMAAWATLRELALPNFLGCLTTAFGFITLMGSSIPMIKKYGMVVAGSVMASWILCHLIFFFLLWWCQPTMRKVFKSRAYWTLLATRWSIPVFSVVFGVTVFSAYLGAKLDFSARLFDDLPKKEEARRVTEAVDRSFGGLVDYNLILRAPTNDYWKEPAKLTELKKYLEEMRNQIGVGSALALSDFMPTPFPKSQGSVAETLFLFSMAERNPLKNFLTEDGRNLRIAFRFEDMTTQRTENLRYTIRDAAEKRFPGMEVIEGGLSVNAHTINTEVSKHLIFGFWESLVLIGLLLVFVFRSLRWAMIACLPNLIPPAVMIGVLTYTRTPVKPGVALIFSIALGLAFNNTVYLLSRLKALMANSNMTHLPLRKAFLMEGNPCLFESLIMASGFLIFLGSEFALNRIFGGFMVLSIVTGFIADLIFLPAFLRIFPETLRRWARFGFSFTGAVVLAGALSLAVGDDAKAAPKADAKAQDVLEKMRANLESKDDQAKVEMNIIEANGAKKTRVMLLKTRYEKKEFSAIVRLESPADLKNTALLATVKNGQQSQWVYLPSTKQVRRIVTTQSKGGVLGSELSPEDLKPEALQGADAKFVKKDDQFTYIDITPKKGTSEYSKVSMVVATNALVPVRSEYYSGKKLAKTVEFKDYKKIGDLWRAQQIDIKNHTNGRGTTLTLSDVKVNQGLKSSDFSANKLKPD